MRRRRVLAPYTGALKAGFLSMARGSAFSSSWVLAKICAGAVWGPRRRSSRSPPANGESLAQPIPGACLELFDGDHIFLMQDPAAFPAMAGFLRDEAHPPNS
ncbi:MAG TPA: hypothetical protein VHS57_08800 [Acidimicrobiales bacterium]|nr:hypothetical protein [Acidimicrobiales bacterium]